MQKQGCFESNAPRCYGNKAVTMMKIYTSIEQLKKQIVSAYE